MRFSLRQLEVFVAVARAQSVSQAAAQLSLSQSAASTALGELEKQLDSKLFDRAGKKLQLNELGRLLLPQATELLDRAGAIEALLLGERAVGPLRIGATLTIGNYLAALLISEFLQQHPDRQVHLEVDNTASIVQRVANFELDLGLIEGESRRPDLVALPWVADELVIFAAAGHPLAQRSALTLEDLLGAKWILREPGSGTRENFDHVMRSALSKLDVLLELAHTEAIKQAVESGLGIGCISKLALRDAFRRGELVPLRVPGLDFSRYFYFLLHKQKVRTPGIEAFLDLCREVAAGVRVSDEIVRRPAQK